MSCDENPMYIDFIPLITKAWNRLNITPVFVIIKDGPITNTITQKSIIYTFPPVSDIDMPFQSTFARIWIWKELKGNCILSDMDMLPISDAYFNGTAAKYSDDTIVSYCDDAIELFNQIAACYILASSKVISKLINEKDWQTFITNRSVDYNQAWGGDQDYLQLLLNKHDKVERLKRGWHPSGQAFNRLDRISWVYSEKQIKAGTLYDCHLLRPYNEHKDRIDELYNLITGQ